MRVPLSIDVPVDARVLAFSLAVTIVATLLVGAAPAFAASRTDVQALVKREEGGAGRGSLARAALLDTTEGPRGTDPGNRSRELHERRAVRAEHHDRPHSS